MKLKTTKSSIYSPISVEDQWLCGREETVVVYKWWVLVLLYSVIGVLVRLLINLMQ